jgi:glycine cleavage system H protein
VIEAVKAASDLYAPVSGRVVEVNTAASEDPSKVAEDPYGQGWMVKIEPSNPSDWDSLLSSQDYDKMIESGEAH